MRLLGANALATEDHALGPALAHQLGQTLGTAGTGQKTNPRLRQCQRRLLLGNADIAGQGDFQATAHRKSIDRGNRHATEIGQRFERLAKSLAYGPGHIRVTGGKLVQISTRRKEFLTRARQH